MSAAFSKGSTMPQRNSFSSISVQDLLRMLPSDSKNGFLREKKTRKYLKTVKWHHRFIVIAKGALYIFENEMSKSPEKSLPLLGYVAVEREAAKTCAWAFALVPAPELSSLQRRCFACSSDADRKDWMSKIRERLFDANNVKREDRSLAKQLQEKLALSPDLTVNEREYLNLELPVMSLDGDKSDKNDIMHDWKDNSDSDSDKDDKFNTDPKVSRDRKSTSLRDKHSSDEPKLLHDRESSSSLRERRYNKVESVRDSENLTPPRYSALVDGEEHVYENQATTPKAASWGFEKACTIEDETFCRDRDKCIAMLKSTRRHGTYLIRQSRTMEYKVLACLWDGDVVKEFRIDNTYGMYHLKVDPSAEFSSIEDLLMHYTNYRKIPALQGFLGWGVHECVDGNRTYEICENDIH